MSRGGLTQETCRSAPQNNTLQPKQSQYATSDMFLKDEDIIFNLLAALLWTALFILYELEYAEDATGREAKARSDASIHSKIHAVIRSCPLELPR